MSRLSPKSLAIALALGGCARFIGSTPSQPSSDAPRSVDGRRDANPSDRDLPRNRDLAGDPPRALAKARLDAPRDKSKADKAKDSVGPKADKVQPGACVSWTAWSCIETAPADAGTYFCRATCPGFNLVCNPATLDCYCNGNWCGKNAAVGGPCKLCQSSWKLGACCGY